jgi:hypothetical protein
VSWVLCAAARPRGPRSSARAVRWAPGGATPRRGAGLCGTTAARVVTVSTAEVRSPRRGAGHGVNHRRRFGTRLDHHGFEGGWSWSIWKALIGLLKMVYPQSHR